MTRVLVIDSETGGLNPATDALLSVGLVDFEIDTGSVLRAEEILIDAEGLICDPKALAVNGIETDLHHAYSIPRAEAAERIKRFVEPMARPFLAGHNVFFDIGFVRRLFTPEDLRKLVSHRFIDTMHVLAYLGHCGVIPENIAKLDQAISHFGLTMPTGQRHTALADALATAELYSRLLDLIRAKARVA